MKIRRFITIAKRHNINNEFYVFGLIHGIQIALCDLDLSKSLDCEMFKDNVMYITDTTENRYDTFRKMVETIYPGLCEFDKK